MHVRFDTVLWKDRSLWLYIIILRMMISDAYVAFELHSINFTILTEQWLEDDLHEINYKNTVLQMRFEYRPFEINFSHLEEQLIDTCLVWHVV